MKFWFKQWYDKEKVDELELRVREVLNRLYKYYSGAIGTPCGASTSGTSEFGSNDVAAMSSMLSGFGSAEERMKRYNNIYKQHLANKDSVECKSKLDQYLNRVMCLWWRVNSSRYRIISQVARDVLAIFISIVVSEFAFSIGGPVLDPFRSSLSPNTVEVLICTQNWLRSNDSTKSINLREVMDEVENYELEPSNVFMFFSNFFSSAFVIYKFSCIFFVIYLFVSYYLYIICFIYLFFPSRACTKTHRGYRFYSRLIWKVGLFFGLSYLR